MGAMKQIEASLATKGKRAKNHAKNPDSVDSAGKGRKKLIPTPEEVTANKAKTGRIKLSDMPEAQRKAEVEELLSDLEAAKESDEKKRIRRALRARGHRGGLNGQGAKKTKEEAKEAKAGK